jgi:hypothetical protein
MATEHRAYEVVRRDDSLELRRYPSYLTASVTVDATGYDEAANAGFNALAGYIFGNNVAAGSIPMTAPVTASRQASEKIAMTVPVTSERARNDELRSASPLCTVGCEGEYVVRFTMPSQYAALDDLPAPNDPRVVLEEVEEHLAVALAFGGRLDDESVAAAVSRLEGWIERDDELEATGEPEAAQYDAPWKPGFMRHNEVLIPVRSA